MYMSFDSRQDFLAGMRTRPHDIKKIISKRLNGCQSAYQGEPPVLQCPAQTQDRLGVREEKPERESSCPQVPGEIQALAAVLRADEEEGVRFRGLGDEAERRWTAYGL